MPDTAQAPSTITFAPIAGTLGAEVRGVDLSAPLTEDVHKTLRQGLRDHLVLVFPATRPLAAERLIDLMRGFGEPDDQPFAGGRPRALSWEDRRGRPGRWRERREPSQQRLGVVNRVVVGEGHKVG